MVVQKRSYKTIIVLSGLLGLLCHANGSYAREARVFRVVIDPGHGGNDEGTVYDNGRTRLTEKDITLQISRQISRHLQMRGYSVTLTRNQDQEVTLPDRTAIANRWGADVFISVHMNSTDPHSTDSRPPHVVEGVETYILNNTTDASSRRLARLENTVVQGSSLSTDNIDSESNLDVALILKDLRLDANLSKSKSLACSIQKNLVTATSKPSSRYRRDRGVKQALFHVLLGADMPSILVEVGFLTNASDRLLLTSARGQNLIARSIADAVEQYATRSPNPLKRALSFSPLDLGRCKVN